MTHVSNHKHPQVSKRTSLDSNSKKLLYGKVNLGEHFNEDKIGDLLVLARQRVLGEFHFAREPRPGYRPGYGKSPLRKTDNYICGVAGRISDLASYVVNNTRRPFILPGDIPDVIGLLRPALIATVIDRLQFEVLSLALQQMRHREVWYDESTGVWQVCQSSMDDYYEYHRLAVVATRKLDDRSWHGRPSRDRSRIPAGTSVGLS